jgi:hypothetical protein
MRVSVDITHNPDVSPTAFIRMSVRAGRAGQLRTMNASVVLGDGLEELEETVCTFFALVFTTTEAAKPDQLWQE